MWLERIFKIKTNKQTKTVFLYVCVRNNSARKTIHIVQIKWNNIHIREAILNVCNVTFFHHMLDFGARVRPWPDEDLFLTSMSS